MILFTDDELDKLMDVEKYNCEAIPMTRDICKAQAKKMWEYLSETCTEHPIKDWCVKCSVTREYLRTHKDCSQCRAEIEKELG